MDHGRRTVELQPDAPGAATGHAGSCNRRSYNRRWVELHLTAPRRRVSYYQSFNHWWQRCNRRLGKLHRAGGAAINIWASCIEQAELLPAGPPVLEPIWWRARTGAPFCYNRGIPELEPVPLTASTGESLRAVETDGKLRATLPSDLFAATGHPFAGTSISFSCHRPRDLLEPDAPSPPPTEFLLKPVSLFGWTQRFKPTTAASRRRGYAGMLQSWRPRAGSDPSDCF